ncbi:MAG: FG-GAP-like repeat-containing protein [Desulfobacterales bacterium]
MRKTQIHIICLAMLLPAVFCQPALAKEPRKVLILPFQIHSEKDLSFLKNGIQDMLGTRLTREGEMIPLGREIVAQAAEGFSGMDEKAAAALGKKHGADYVVFGSLTAMGEKISTDARLLEVSAGRTRMNFNESGDSGDVISHIDRFASQVNEELFGEPKPEKTSSQNQEDTVDESRRHPDSLWTGRIESEGGRPAAGLGEAAAQLGSVWKSRNFKTAIIGLSIGDTDGDGSNEIVFADEKNVHVHRRTKDGFLKVAEIEGETLDSLLSVDAADINGNGKAEIFVSNLNRDSKILRSFVLEWDGTRFQKIVSDARWYFRVIDVPKRGSLLMGQQRGISKIFLPGVEELRWDGSQYAGTGTQTLPSKVNVFGFNYGDVTNSGRDLTVSFGDDTYLRVADPEGKDDWKSPDPYGGSALFLEYPMEASASIGSHQEQDRFYLPQRILIADVDNDGKNEVLVNRGKDAARRLFARVRIFNGGQIECLAWDNFGLYPKWMTRQISGYLSDYAVGDTDGDGKKELVFSVVAKTSSVLGNARSYIATQEIVP